MKTYEIKRWTNRWSDIPTLDISEKYFDTPDTVSAQAQIAYDDDNIYVRLETEEYEHRNLEKGPLGEPCLDCCLEFFFAPIEGDDRYLNIEMNSNYFSYIGIAHSMDDIVRLMPDKGIGIFSPVVDMKEGSWSLEYKIPSDFVRLFFPDFSLYEGKKMRANCFKCAEGTNPPHYLSWSPLKTDNFTFHQSECFGEMIFVN